MSFLPAAKFNREYRESIVRKSLFGIALENHTGIIVKEFEIDLDSEKTSFYIDRSIKFMLWAYGAHTLFLRGDNALALEIKKSFQLCGSRSFDIDIMSKAFRREFVVSIVDDLPLAFEKTEKIGGFLDGNRIGFDLGASDYKIAAVKDGQVLFSKEIPWNPVVEKDPNYHYEKIKSGLQEASSKLEHLDAIGGSSAGIVINNEIRIASLFRSVPLDKFEKDALTIFSKLEKEWGVPLKVINDGDVTALAGSLSLKKGGILGIAMGSSEACGYIDREGKIKGWLNELAFAPLDYSEQAAQDEWSKDYGVGAMYFSQQAVNRLATDLGVSFPDEMGLPERLIEVQKWCEEGDKKSSSIFTTIGNYLGHTVIHYREYYDFDTVLILGRVTSGLGGELILSEARKTVKESYPESNILFEVPDDEFRRVGQAIAAASLVESKP